MKIAFTSCTRYEAYATQPQWFEIAKAEPDYLFLLGDNIYMDFWKLGEPMDFELEVFKTVMVKKYEQQWREPYFKALIDKMQKKNGLFAIWDDHDSGWNNLKGAMISTERERAKLAFSREQFHKYFDNCSTNLPEVYYSIDTEWARVVFLDNRSYAQEEGLDSELLGEAQFQFLAEQLDHTLPCTIICGGITLTRGKENWEGYPKELKRLCELVKAKKRVLFLGGDIHNIAFEPATEIDNGLYCPPQLIASGMAQRPSLSKQNWAMLELEQNHIKVQFHNKRGVKKSLTEACNTWLQAQPEWTAW